MASSLERSMCLCRGERRYIRTHTCCYGEGLAEGGGTDGVLGGDCKADVLPTRQRTSRVGGARDADDAPGVKVIHDAALGARVPGHLDDVEQAGGHSTEAGWWAEGWDVERERERERESKRQRARERGERDSGEREGREREWRERERGERE